VTTRVSSGASTPEPDGRGLRLAIHNGHLRAMHVGDDAPHDLGRTRRARHEPRAQAAEVALREFRVFALRDEHRRYPVNDRAAPAFDRRHRRGRIELRRRQNQPAGRPLSAS
jgi:hypothetical protein